MKRFSSAGSVIAMITLAGWPAAAELRLDSGGGAVIAIERPGLYPEGVDHDPRTGRTFMGSVRQGEVAALLPDGRVTSFATDPRLISIIGVRVDARNRRLLVGNADYGVAERSSSATDRRAGGVAIFDLETGALLRYVDLAAVRPGAPIFVNDLDVDADGNAYVTNSLSPIIYRITPEGTASVFLEDERFVGPGFNLNGVRVHPDGYLLVAKKSDGSLFRVPLADPRRWTEVRLPEPMVATDGILLRGGDLLLLRNRTATVAANEAVLLRSADGWTSATLAGRAALPDDYAATATIKAGAVWAVEGRLHTLRPGAEAGLRSFTLRRVATVVE